MDRIYERASIIMPTKHAKSLAVAPAFFNILGSNILEYVLDTDTLGTFSGEVERLGSSIDCARRKCTWALEILGDKVDYVLASEGSFGPHPAIPFIACNEEILYFIDRKRGFHLHLRILSEKTNYHMQVADTWDEILDFAHSATFPSHGLIMRPNNRNEPGFLFKGILNKQLLKDAFAKCSSQSKDGKVWVQTDMRAHMNPSRMTVIGELAEKMARRLNTLCPSCKTPGWGQVGVEKGLPCEYCHQPTDMVSHDVFGCVLCDHQEVFLRTDEVKGGIKLAPQMYCMICNP